MFGNKANWKKWLVVLGCFCLNSSLLGITRANGVLYVALLTHFNSTRKQAAWPSVVYTIVLSVVGPFAGLLTRYFKIRTLVFVSALISSLGIIACYFTYSLAYITVFYGACYGFGIGLIIPLTHLTVNQHFKHKMATASGFVFAGSTVGGFLFPPLTTYLLEHYALSGTFLLLGGIALHSLVGALLYLPAKEEKSKDGQFPEEHQELMKSTDVHGDKSLHDLNKLHPSEYKSDSSLWSNFTSVLRELRVFIDILTDPMFLIVSATFTLTTFVLSIYMMVIVDFAMDRKIEEAKAVYLISIFCAGDLLGRICTGWIADLKYVQRKYVVIVAALCLGTLTILIPLADTYWLLMTLSASMGTVSGSKKINFSAVMEEGVGAKKFPVAMGMGLLLNGVFSSARADLIGLFRDRTGSYDSLLHTGGVLLYFSAALWLFEPVIKRYRARKEREENNAQEVVQEQPM